MYFISYIVFVLFIEYSCSSKTPYCEIPINCSKLFPNSTFTVQESKCLYKDQYQQNLLCEERILSVKTNDKKLNHYVELDCPENTNVVVISAEYINSQNKTVNNITNVIRQLCFLSEYCVYHYQRSDNCKEKCFETLQIQYFCKESKYERKQCDSHCHDQGICKQCSYYNNNLSNVSCISCHCTSQVQVLLPNNSINNRFCNWQPTDKPLSTGGIVALIVISVLLTSMFLTCATIAIIKRFHKSTSYTRHMNNSQLLTFTVDPNDEVL